MALSDEILQDIVSNLSPEDRKQLNKQLELQILQDEEDIKNGKELLSPINKPKPKKQRAKVFNTDNNKIYCCVYCGSAMRYSHIDKETWLEMLRGLYGYVNKKYVMQSKICMDIMTTFDISFVKAI